MTDAQALQELRKAFGLSPGLTSLAQQVAAAHVEGKRVANRAVYDPYILARNTGRIEGVEDFLKLMFADSADSHRTSSPDRTQ